MPKYRGIIVVTHDGDVHLDELIKHLAERTSLEVVDSEIDGLQVVILWRSLVDVDGDLQ